MEKVELPTKTKIAAWLIILIGLIGGWGLCVSTLHKFYVGRFELKSLIYIPLIFIILFIGFNILKKRKWAWWAACIPLFITILLFFFPFSPFMFALMMVLPYALYPDCVLHNCRVHGVGNFYDDVAPVLIILILAIVSFILLLVDRKNFWKIAQ